MTNNKEITEKYLITDNTILRDNFITRKDITLTRHSIATLIQLNNIVFRINELNDIAVYNSKLNILDRIDIKELVQPLIFPVLSNAKDDKKIKEYFDIIYYDELRNFNNKGNSMASALDMASGHKEEANYKILAQKHAQRKLREFYNTETKTRAIRKATPLANGG